MSGDWYARPVLSVRDATTALAFYTDNWRFEDEGRMLIVQVSRQACSIILSQQWPQDAAEGRLLISLDPPDFEAMQVDLAARGAPLGEGMWG